MSFVVSCRRAARSATRFRLGPYGGRNGTGGHSWTTTELDGFNQETRLTSDGLLVTSTNDLIAHLLKALRPSKLAPTCRELSVGKTASALGGKNEINICLVDTALRNKRIRRRSIPNYSAIFARDSRATSASRRPNNQ